MSILNRFSSIISANVNAILDRMEDPAKMIDQYMREMLNDLAEVKENTAGVMAEEARTKRLVDENEGEVKKYESFAKKAIESGNDGDARIFLTKKQELEDIGTGLANAYAKAHENASKMRQMHDKLAKDIEILRSRREMIKAQSAVADTQEKLNAANDRSGASQDAMANFNRMEERVQRRLDKASAMETLNEEPVDSAKALEAKYANDLGSAAVEDELARMKADMGLSVSKSEEDNKTEEPDEQ